MPTLVHYIPILTTLVAFPFAIVLYRHWRRKPSALYLFWWFAGVAFYGMGTLAEGLTTLLGWQEGLFRTWYIVGALLGGAPLAQGTVYLLMRDRVAHVLTAVLLTAVVVASVCVLLTPIDYSLVEGHRLSGAVMEWQWVRLFSPFINVYAFIFLVGGAVYSAWQYARRKQTGGRMWGNVFIAVGALLPGIGGSFTRFGHVEVLYVTELIGLLFIWLGYRQVSQAHAPSVHANQTITS